MSAVQQIVSAQSEKKMVPLLLLPASCIHYGLLHMNEATELS
jgi:hypothetical protein